MSGRVLVGTCSWADKTITESGWYPPDVKTPEERLRYYSEQFPVVEIDSTYYAIPSERNPELWVERTPPEFRFNVKSYALFTGHGAAVKAFPKALKDALPGQLQEKRNLYLKDLPQEIGDEMWRRFVDVLLPMDSAGKLGAVLFQFPPWFGPSRANREYVLECKERLGQYTMAVEFRNATWMAEERDRERTLSFLSEHSLPYVCVDEPQGFRSSVPPVTAVTAPLAMVRLHGRNAEMWERRVATAAERFDYLYSEEELREWEPRVRELSEGAREVHVMFNNCHGDKGMRNAREMAEMLGASMRGEGRDQVTGDREQQEGEQRRLM